LLGAVDEVPELLAHDFRAAYHTPDDRLVEDRPQARPVLAGQYALAFHADLHSALDVIPVQFARAIAECLPCVLFGLEQAGHHDGLEVADGSGPGFQADVDLIRVGQDVAEGVPPVGGKFYRIPPKDDSYRSLDWEPCLPVDLPPFLAALLARQAQSCPRRTCACIAEHGGSGLYLFPSPDGRHHRRSNYGRRVFRPACDGRHEPVNGGPPRIVTVKATAWPGVPFAVWPAAILDKESRSSPARYVPPRGRGIRTVPDGVPVASWLPLVPGLTAHGLRHGHRTWMAEDGIPDTLAEQRLGHEVPGMRGLCTHVSDRMRDALAQALQARWEDSLRARAAIRPHSPAPLLDELLAPHRPREAGRS